jgi:general secretion pathway protein G
MKTIRCLKRFPSRALQRKTIDRQHGFAFLMLAIIAFLAAAAGLTAVAGFVITNDQRRTEASELSDVYRAITGDPSKDQFGYLGDVGDYPHTLADLLSAPQGVAGWQGPYVSDAILSGVSFYDPFGTPIDYFLKLVPGSPDKLALISKGPDHASSNAASNPNDSAQFTSPYPSDGASYLNAGGNADNIAYPDFSTTVSALEYENAGSLKYNIVNKDTNVLVNSVLDACPLLYKLVVTSHTRRSADTITLGYSPGLTNNFVQGLYDVSVTSPLIQGAFYSEIVAIHPGQTTTRTLRAGDVDSSLTPAFTLFVTNNTAGPITLKRSGVVVGVLLAGVQNANMGPVAVCGSMTAEDGSGTLDSWVMPWGTNSKRVIGGSYHTLTVTNLGAGAARRQLKILRDGVLLGTVYQRKSVAFANVPDGASITINDQADSLVATTTMGASDMSVSY